MALHPAVLLLALALCIACLTPGVAAFGAGEIPEYAHKAGIAYRHGTIENILETLAKSARGGGAGRLLVGVAGALLSGNAGELGNAVSGKGSGSKFSGLDVKRVYFGNWLRDYSQCMDIAGLSKLSGDSLLLLVMCLGFTAFGYATGEFEVTKEKLGVYLCTEHIDNPKGYGEGTDARQYDPRLRGPVEDRELEIDPQNGMKRYIASEGQGFDTSAACIRGHLRRCIELGRQGGDQNRFEAYRELGTALHTLEDFLAHSNYLELALNKLGHRDVFCHVGDNVRVRAPNGQNVPPIVTGTFGGNDFIVSVLGEVGDKLSSATVNDLNTKFSDAKTQGNQQQGGAIQLIKTLMGSMPSGGGGEGEDKKQNVNQQLENVEQIRKNAINIDPSKLASAEVQKIFIDVLTTRDNIFKNVEQLLEMFGLDEKIDELGNALAVLVLTTLEPYVLPIIRSVTEGLAAGSAAMLQKEDQLIVFNDDNASDPTHSVLSKDHFDLWLNQPAGMVAIDVVKHTVPLIVQAWSDNSNPDDAINIILQAIHHPYWLRDECAIQKRMLETVRSWVDSLDQSERNKILSSLTKESVKAGNNKREDSELYGTLGHRCSGGAGHEHHAGGGAGPSLGYNTGTMGSGGNHRLATGNRITGNPAQTTFGGQSTGSSVGGGMGLAGGFGGMQQGIGQAMEQRHSDRQNEQSSNTAYGTQSGYEANQGRQSGYGRQDDNDDHASSRYGRHEQGQQEHDSHRDSDDRRYNQESSGYGGQPARQSGYGGNADEERTGYNHPARNEYGQSRNDDDDRRQQYGRDEGRHESSYGRNDERDNQHSQYSSGGNRRHDDDDNNRERHGRDNDYGGQGRRHDDDNNEYGRQSGNSYQQNRRDDDQTDYASRMGRMNLGSDEGRSQYGTGGGDDDNRGQYGGGGYQRQQAAGESRFGHQEEDNNRNERQQTRYGRGGDNDDDNHGRRHRDDDDERRGGQSYGSFNEGRRSDNDDGNRSSYGQSGYGQTPYRRDDGVSRAHEKPHKHSKAKSDSEDDDYKKQLKKQENEMKKYSKKQDKGDDHSDDEKSRKKKDKKHDSDSSDEKDKKAKKRDSYDQQKKYYEKHDDDHKKYEKKQKKKNKHAGSSTEDSD